MAAEVTGFQKTPWRRGLVNNSTHNTSFQTVVPTTTEPVTVDSASPADNCLLIACGMSNIDLLPFGIGDENHTFDIRLMLWRKAENASGSTVLWVPSHMGDLNLTVSAAIGVAASSVLNTERFADTVVLASGGSTKIVVRSPTGDLIGGATIQTDGAEKLGVYFKRTGATSCNVLWSRH